MNILAAFRRWYWQDLPDAAQAKMLREVRKYSEPETYGFMTFAQMRNHSRHISKIWEKASFRYLWNPAKGAYQRVYER